VAAQAAELAQLREAQAASVAAQAAEMAQLKAMQAATLATREAELELARANAERLRQQLEVMGERHGRLARTLEEHRARYAREIARVDERRQDEVHRLKEQRSELRKEVVSTSRSRNAQRRLHQRGVTFPLFVAWIEQVAQDGMAAGRGRVEDDVQVGAGGNGNLFQRWRAWLRWYTGREPPVWQLDAVRQGLRHAVGAEGQYLFPELRENMETDRQPTLVAVRQLVEHLWSAEGLARWGVTFPPP
jgi:hypothetical protein